MLIGYVKKSDVNLNVYYRVERTQIPLHGMYQYFIKVSISQSNLCLYGKCFDSDFI
jgi:hypothetical protein